MNQIDEMACNELVEVVSEYLDAALADEDRCRFDAQLEECPYCVRYLEQFRETINATGELTLDSIAAERRAEVVGPSFARRRRAGRPCSS